MPEQYLVRALKVLELLLASLLALVHLPVD
jgi:hypothetical protein